MNLRVFRLTAVSLFVFLLFARPSRAEISPSAESARPYGMGNAFTAVANDVNAILFNPAGLSTVQQIEVGGAAARTLPGGSPKTDMMAAGAVPLNFYKDAWKNGTAGFAFHSNGGSRENANTTLSVSAGIAPHDFISERWRVISSFIPVPERFHVGSTLRFRRVTHGITGGTAYGLGMDLGFLYQFEESVKASMDGWSVGLAFQEMNMASVGGGPSIRLGGAWRRQRYIVAMDMVTQDGITRFQPGAEVSFFKRLLLLRAGTGVSPGRPRQLVLGIGTLLPPIELDLAYGFPVSDLDLANDRAIVSFTYRFGSPLLGQYLDESNKRNAADTEMSLTNLEYKRAALDASVREQRALYEKIDADIRKAREKTEVAVGDLERAQKRLAEQNEKIVNLNRQIEDLERKKAGTQAAVDAVNQIQPEIGRRVFFHKVEKGDTLRTLAEKYYGDSGKWNVIFDANRSKIRRGSLKEGEEIIIP